MCGLFGMAGPGIILTDFKVLDDLRKVSALRGDDGTGLYAGRSGKHHTGYNVVGDAYYWQFCLPDKRESTIYSVQNDWFIGHCRSRTRGLVNAVQPFELKNIIGCHNGTLNGQIGTYMSDSQKLLAMIDEAENIQTVFDEMDVEDSYALVWYNKLKKTINFLRNKRRELYFATCGNVIFWASESDMLRLVLNRNHYVNYQIFSIPEDSHFSIKVQDIAHSKKYNGLVKESTVNAPTIYHHGWHPNDKFPKHKIPVAVSELPWYVEIEEMEKNASVNQ